MNSATPEKLQPQQAAKSQALSLFFAGLLPVIAFTVIEEKYGTIAGLIAGMAFGVGEIIWELYKHRRVNQTTWIGNSLLLVLGAISLISDEGIWFKLQPAIMEAAFALFLWIPLIFRKNILVSMMQKQGAQFPAVLSGNMNWLCFRVGLFLVLHAALATWAAIYWSTTAWALLKGLGFTISFVVYMIFEALYLRRAIKVQQKIQPNTPPNA